MTGRPALQLLVGAALLLAACSHAGGEREAPVPSPVPSAEPSPTWTPPAGALNPDVTQATIGKTICVAGWSDSVRPASLPLRPRAGYEVDHYTPISLGGALADRLNLWYEPQPRAAQVDVLETALHGLVCRKANPLPLAVAQKMIDAVKRVG